MSEGRGFYLVQDELTRQRLIRQCAKSSAPATLWTRGRDMVVRAELSHFDATAGTFRVELPEEMRLGKTLKILSKGGEVFFNIDFESSRVLFRTALHFFDDEKHLLEFKIPAQIYRIQERNFPRLDTRKNPAIAAFHLDPHPPERRIRREVLDLGAGGVALRMFVGEERHYHVGQVLESVQLHIGQKVIEVRAEVRSIRLVQVEPEKSELAMGLSFLGLEEASRRFISEYVDAELVKQFGAAVLDAGTIRD